MKLSIIATATLFGLSLMPLAQAQVAGTLQGNIPFDFQVANATLPAGSYLVTALGPGSHATVMRSNSNETKAKAIMFMASASGRASATSAAPKLIFHRYGSTYFLSEIRGGDGQAASLLPVSKAERTIARQVAALHKQGSMELASVTFQPAGD